MALSLQLLHCDVSKAESQVKCCYHGGLAHSGACMISLDKIQMRYNVAHPGFK